MGTIYGPYDIASWRTMLMLKEDNQNMTRLSTEKHILAIKCNNNCLKDFFSYRAA